MQVSRHVVVSTDASTTGWVGHVQRACSCRALDRAPAAVAYQFHLPVPSSIPTGVGGLAGFCRALERVSNSGVFQGIPLVSHTYITSNVTD